MAPAVVVTGLVETGTVSVTTHDGVIRGKATVAGRGLIPGQID